MIVLEKYIEDKRFIRWVFQPDAETEKYYSNYFKEHPDEKDEMLMIRKELLKFEFQVKKYAPELPENIYQRIQSEIVLFENKRKKHLRLNSIVKYAAIAILLLATGFFASIVFNSQQAKYQFSEDLFLMGTMVEPRLYLAEGNSVIVPGPDYEVTYLMDGRIVVGADTIKASKVGKRDRKMDALVVSFGRKVKLVLPDGSRVWVNSGSRLIFPHKFDAKKREVFLSGEGYFDVERNTERPFFVRTTAMAVKVLGTEFNVSAFPESDNIETVLKEGSVQIEENGATWFGEKAMLVPDQKATFNKQTKKIKVTAVEHENYTLWKEGLVTIENETLEDVFGKIERFFNIDIQVLNKDNAAMQISGKLDFNVGRQRVFEYLEKLTNGKFKEIGPGKYVFE